jgi:hypothetical protein
MELILRGSEYQDFLTCRRKWYHGWVEKITPKRPDGKLFFGNLFHKWLEYYYNEGCNKLQADLMTSLWFNQQDTKDMEQTDIDEILSLFKGVSEYYHETYGESDSRYNVLGTEVEFVVKLQDDIYYTGTIDLVYELDGKVRFKDHKTVASISMYEEKAKMDRQISRYWWALKMIAAGIGMIKSVDEDGKVNWVPWVSLLDKEIDGFDYNIIAKDYPREPTVLKSGKLSVDKSQKTTFKKFRDKAIELGQSPNDYINFLEMLKTKQDPFLRRIDVQRTAKELDSAIWELLYTGGDIHDIKMMVTEFEKTGKDVEPLIYRNIGQHCEHMCQFKSLCQATIAGDNVSLVRNLGYKKNEER